MMQPMMGLARQAQDYWIDASQRSILFLDALRRRGNTHFEHAARAAPNVLNFAFELVAGIAVDECKRPFIVFDPRAGDLSQDAERHLEHVESLFASVSGKTVSAHPGMAGIAAS